MSERIDTWESWLITVAAVVAASVSLGTPYVVIVALKPIAEELGGFRSVPSGGHVARPAARAWAASTMW